jgi:hypothetical protein
MRILNERVNASGSQAIADQFNFIGKVTADICKLSEPLHAALVSSQAGGG